jgi:nucleotide-binding universal stress UspA family protein
VKILVAYDGSRVAKEGIKLAEKHAKAFNAEIFIVHSLVGGAQVPRQEFERAEKVLEDEKIQLHDKNVACEVLLSVRGLEPGEDLVKLAREEKVEEIIIGIRKKSKVGKLVFGSTAQYLILNAPCPVVSVK